MPDREPEPYSRRWVDGIECQPVQRKLTDEQRAQMFGEMGHMRQAPWINDERLLERWHRYQKRQAEYEKQKVSEERLDRWLSANGSLLIWLVIISLLLVAVLGRCEGSGSSRDGYYDDCRPAHPYMGC